MRPSAYMYMYYVCMHVCLYVYTLSIPLSLPPSFHLLATLALNLAFAQITAHLQTATK